MLEAIVQVLAWAVLAPAGIFILCAPRTPPGNSRGGSASNADFQPS